MREHNPCCPYGAAAVGVGSGSSSEDCKYCSFLHRKPAFLLLVSETACLNVVSTKQWAYSKKSMVIHMEGLPRNVAVQAPGCRECLSLLLPREGGRHSTCVRCEQVDEQLRLGVELTEEMETLMTIRECEWETDWQSDSLACRREGCQRDNLQKSGCPPALSQSDRPE